MTDIAVIIISAAVFTAVILGLAVNQDDREKWVGFTFMIAAIGGICLYGASYAHEELFLPIAILKTVIDVGKMFSGSNNAAVFQKYAGGQAPLMMFFWCIHFLAYYSMASAIIMVMAKTTLKKIRGWFLRINDVDLIYGIDDNSIAYGRNLSGNRKTSVVFVGSDAGGREAEIRQIGGLLYSDSTALNPDKKFLKRLSVKPGKCRFRLSALSKDADANLEYAVKVLKCLKENNIYPTQTELVLLGREVQRGTRLQAFSTNYGYGSVKIFDKAELIARLLMQEYPICNAITFDQDAKATCDTDILLVGFGHKGQEILKKLVMSGQFEGSHFHLTVFDAGSKDTDGFFDAKYPDLLNKYDIDFMPYDGRSRAFTSYLKESIHKLKYIVIAVGNDKIGREIAMGILDYMYEYGVHMPVYQCMKDRIVRYTGDSTAKKHDIYDADILYEGHMDELAKRLNHYYCKADVSIEDTWAECNYFNRMSSRASADFLSAFLRRLGLSDKAQLTPEIMENLAKTEHLRWCAFHYAFGYKCMDEKTLHERAKLHKQDSSVRIAKDPSHKLHACLVPWDDLDTLSAYESDVTGRSVDYKQMDRDNVNVILDLMKKEQ